MKRVIKINIQLSDGSIEATVKLNIVNLVREEQQRVVDEITDNVVGALRTIPYHATAPYRCIKIK